MNALEMSRRYTYMPIEFTEIGSVEINGKVEELMQGSSLF
jgi:hypothetical protein